MCFWGFMTKISVFYVLLLWNSIVFLIYGIDKLKAIKKSQRVSELTLLTCAFLLGGIGAALGMIVFNHKTSKIKFRVLIPLFLVSNYLIVYYINFSKILSFFAYLY